MSIVFDHVEGVVQRAAEGDGGDAPTAASAPPQARDPEQLALELARVQRRRERLEAD